jgi:hypothetical protein
VLINVLNAMCFVKTHGAEGKVWAAAQPSARRRHIKFSSYRPQWPRLVGEVHGHATAEHLLGVEHDLKGRAALGAGHIEDVELAESQKAQMEQEPCKIKQNVIRL